MTEDYEDPDTKKPGLHRVGPEPYDFVYNPAKGERITVQLNNGDLIEATITDVEEDELLGTKTITMQRWPSDVLKYYYYGDF